MTNKQNLNALIAALLTSSKTVMINSKTKSSFAKTASVILNFLSPKNTNFSLSLTLVVFIVTMSWKFTKSAVISFVSDAESATSKLLFHFLFLSLCLSTFILSNSSVSLSISFSKLSSCTSNTTFLFVLLKLA